MRLRDTLDKIVDKQHELNLILVRLTSTVEEHVKRSDALEKHVSLIEAEMDKVKTHVDMVNGFAKICAWSIVVGGGLIGIVAALQKLIALLS